MMGLRRLVAAGNDVKMIKNLLKNSDETQER
jgi:hypothetical protein